jgi:hypothetical protein
LTLRDNQTKNTLARDKPIGKYQPVAAKDYHPDCRADLIQVVALHATLIWRRTGRSGMYGIV